MSRAAGEPPTATSPAASRLWGDGAAPALLTPSPAHGSDTFRRIADYPREKLVVELAVDYAVADMADLTFTVSHWRGAEKLRDVWRPAG